MGGSGLDRLGRWAHWLGAWFLRSVRMALNSLRRSIRVSQMVNTTPMPRARTLAMESGIDGLGAASFMPGSCHGAFVWVSCGHPGMSWNRPLSPLNFPTGAAPATAGLGCGLHHPRAGCRMLPVRKCTSCHRLVGRCSGWCGRDSAHGRCSTAWLPPARSRWQRSFSGPALSHRFSLGFQAGTECSSRATLRARWAG